MSSRFQHRTGILSILAGATLLSATVAQTQQPTTPSTAQEWVLSAGQCVELCRFSALQHALRLEPESRDALMALADYYHVRNQHEKARDILQKITARDPKDFEARKKLADLYMQVQIC